MTINSVTSNRALYEAMVQQAAALRAAPESRALPARTTHPQAGQASTANAGRGESAAPAGFASSLSAQIRQTESPPPALPAPVQPEAQQPQRRLAEAYRGPSADANRLVVQTRAPRALAVPSGSETAVEESARPKAESTHPTFVEVHNVYVDATDEEAGHLSRNPLLQFASQLYQNVVATNRRSTAGEFAGASFSAVA